MFLAMKGVSNQLPLLDKVAEGRISSQRLIDLLIDPDNFNGTHVTDTRAPHWSDFWVFNNPVYESWISIPYSSTTLYVAHKDLKTIQHTSQLIARNLENSGASVFTFMFEPGSVRKNGSRFSRALLLKVAAMSADQHRDELLHRFLGALEDKVKTADMIAKAPPYKTVEEAFKHLFESNDQYPMEALQLALGECELKWCSPFVIVVYGLDSVLSNDQRGGESTNFRTRLVRIINTLRNRVNNCRVVFTDRSSTIFEDSKDFKLLDYSAILDG